MLVMLMGGPADGHIVEFNDYRDVIVWPVVRDAFFENGPVPTRIATETYRYRRIATPDHWVQVVFVHTAVDLETVTESEMIRAIMTVWRARHQKIAHLPHLPSGFTVTEETLSDQPDWFRRGV